MFFLKVLYDMDTDATDQLVIDLIRQRWKPMAEGETGTVWEGFGPGEYCHDMGATPAYFLSRYVLGVRIDAPVANRRIVIQPRLADLAQASGVVVTEFGPVPVSWKRFEDGLHFEVEVPENATATLALPCQLVDASVVVDGRTVDIPESRTGRFLTVAVGAGKHSGSVNSQP